MADESTNAVLHYPGGEYEMPIRSATEGASAVDIGSLLSKTDLITLDSGFGSTASCASEITYIDGDAGILRYRGYPIDQLAEGSTFLETSYLLIYGELPTKDRAGRVHQADQPAHPAARGPEAVLRRLPARRAPDAGAVQRGQRAVDLLPGQPRPVQRRRRGAVHGPAAGQAADDRRLRLQEVDRPAVPLPGQLARAGGELPADDVRLPGRAVRRRPGLREGAGPAADPARRPRAELLDLHGAAGRLVAGQPVRQHLGGHQRAVRAAARRGEPGGAGDAAEDPARGGRGRRVLRRSGSRTRTTRAPG